MKRTLMLSLPLFQKTRLTQLATNFVLFCLAIFLSACTAESNGTQESGKDQLMKPTEAAETGEYHVYLSLEKFVFYRTGSDNPIVTLIGYEGTFEIVDSCVVMKDDDGTYRVPLWPEKVSVLKSTHGYSLIDAAGNTLATQGQKLSRGRNFTPIEYIRSKAKFDEWLSKQSDNICLQRYNRVVVIRF
jgi:hypothetical protein